MKTFRDVACTVCGCVCDDLTLTFDGDRLVGEERACELARPWLYSLNDAGPPVARIQGVEAALDDAPRTGSICYKWKQGSRSNQVRHDKNSK